MPVTPRDENGRFLPGYSANPGGRPATRPLSEAYRDRLAQPYPADPQGRTYAQVIAEKTVAAAVDGDTAAARELADRTEGKPSQPIEVGSGETGPRLTVAELDELYAMALARDPERLERLRALLETCGRPVSPELGPAAPSRPALPAPGSSGGST